MFNGYVQLPASLVNIIRGYYLEEGLDDTIHINGIYKDITNIYNLKKPVLIFFTIENPSLSVNVNTFVIITAYASVETYSLLIPTFFGDSLIVNIRKDDSITIDYTQ